MWIADQWKEYEVIGHLAVKKLERWGNISWSVRTRRLSGTPQKVSRAGKI